MRKGGCLFLYLLYLPVLFTTRRYAFGLAHNPFYFYNCFAAALCTIQGCGGSAVYACGVEACVFITIAPRVSRTFFFFAISCLPSRELSCRPVVCRKSLLNIPPIALECNTKRSRLLLNQMLRVPVTTKSLDFGGRRQQE